MRVQNSREKSSRKMSPLKSIQINDYKKGNFGMKSTHWVFKNTLTLSLVSGTQNSSMQQQGVYTPQNT